MMVRLVTGPNKLNTHWFVYRQVVIGLKLCAAYFTVSNTQ